MWVADQFTSAKGALKSLQPLLDKLSSISLTRALTIMRVWGCVQQLKGYPYPWGLIGDVMDYESPANDELFESLQAYFGDSIRCSNLLEKNFPHVEILSQSVTSDGLVPAFALCADHSKQRLVLAIRGSAEVADWLINFSCKVDEDSCHSGFWKSSNIMLNQVRPIIEQFLEQNETYILHITGHSMGAAVACVVAILLKPQIPNLRAWCFATPKCLNQAMSEECVDYVTTVCYGRDIVSHTCFATSHLILSLLDELGQHDDFELLGDNYVLRSQEQEENSEQKAPRNGFDVVTLKELDTMLIRRLNVFNQMFGFPQEIHSSNLLEVLVDTLKATVKRNLTTDVPAPVLSDAEARRNKEWDGFRSNPPSAAQSTRHSSESTKPSIDWFLTELTKQIVDEISSPIRLSSADRRIVQAEGANSGSSSSSDCNSSSMVAEDDLSEDDLELLLKGYFKWPWSKPGKDRENIPPKEDTLAEDDASPTTTKSSAVPGFLHNMILRVARNVIPDLGSNQEDKVRTFIDTLASRIALEGKTDTKTMVSEYKQLMSERFAAQNEKTTIALSPSDQEAAESLYNIYAKRLSELEPRLHCPGRLIQIIPLSHFVCGDPEWTTDSERINSQFCEQLWRLLTRKDQLCKIPTPLTSPSLVPSHVFVDATASRRILYDPLFKISSFEDHTPGSYTKALVPDLRIF